VQQAALTLCTAPKRCYYRCCLLCVVAVGPSPRPAGPAGPARPPPPPHRCEDVGIGADQAAPAASLCLLISPPTQSMPLTLPLDPRMLAHARLRSRLVTRYEPTRKRGVSAQVIWRQTPTPRK
jgi:hypothetical protein